MFDLHSHTSLSDGELSPQNLIIRAHSAGLQCLAITDHDCIDAHLQIERGQITVPESLDIIPGTEISTGWENQEIHILGLLINQHDQPLRSLLQEQQQRRRERAAQIGKKLERAGICGLEHHLNILACAAPGRLHIADFLLKQGKVTSKQQAFSKYLAKKGKAYVSAQWCSIGEAVAAIRHAGGVAAIAHPDRYTLSRPRFNRLIDEFVEAGGNGIEVSYSNLNPDILSNLARISREKSLWATAGSDFHSPQHHWMDLGRIRRLPEQCAEQAIWHHPRWQIFARPVEQ
ncbi:PHP domain-containing protein [Pseudohongiella spirulinae]|uniref:PHP domain protein n=1 Tax=Pseudohongiella spirulinae TaxID=1249552 RepID=A0A0S2KC46_9GAMM|nr:PHP domain-containing protein [Pseudohongiella spirulinae]ALO45869.1 PHP domain protein [Pseudohongiella spirulinae]